MTLGLVGLGHVGREVARRAAALGFTVIGYDPFAGAVPGVSVVSFEELLGRSDVVSVHARQTLSNQRMFSSDAFALMRPGSFFINTAREGLVDEAALYLALSSGRLGGATAETLARGARRVVAAVGDLLAGRMPADVINPQVLRAAL